VPNGPGLFVSRRWRPQASGPRTGWSAGFGSWTCSGVRSKGLRERPGVLLRSGASGKPGAARDRAEADRTGIATGPERGL
jgi:hypothetical protein